MMNGRTQYMVVYQPQPKDKQDVYYPGAFFVPSAPNPLHSLGLRSFGRDYSVVVTFRDVMQRSYKTWEVAEMEVGHCKFSAQREIKEVNGDGSWC